MLASPSNATFEPSGENTTELADSDPSTVAAARRVLGAGEVHDAQLVVLLDHGAALGRHGQHGAVGLDDLAESPATPVTSADESSSSQHAAASTTTDGERARR